MYHLKNVNLLLLWLVLQIPGGLTNHQHSCSTKKWVERIEQKEKMERYAQQRVQEYIQMEPTRRLDRVSSGFVQLSNDFKLLDQRVDSCSLN